MKDIKATILGIPLDLGSERIGVDMGPNALRYQKMAGKLKKAGIEVRDMGNINCPLPENVKIGHKNMKYAKTIISVAKEVAQSVNRLIQRKQKVIAIGGDHSISLGTISGASKALDGKMGVIWLDAHGDLNTDKNTPTGNIHGMSLAALMGFGHKDLLHVCDERIAVAKENVLLVGVKDLDQGEQQLIKKENINVFSIIDILAHGLNPLFKIISKLQKKAGAIWVSIDLDAVDSQYAPGVGIPNNGGLSYREITAICQYIGKNCHVVGVDIVEYNPVNDLEHKTANLSIEIISKLLGSDYTSYTEYLLEHQVK